MHTTISPATPADEGPIGDWRHHAACRDEDPELFFPVGNDGPALLQVAEAKTVCRRCPVAATCLTWALESGQDAGVWGGMSEDERRALTQGNRSRQSKRTEEAAPEREIACHASALSADAIAQVKRLYEMRGGNGRYKHTVIEIAREVGVTPDSIYRALREGVISRRDRYGRVA